MAAKIYMGKGGAVRRGSRVGFGWISTLSGLRRWGRLTRAARRSAWAIAAGLPEVLIVALGEVQDDLYIVGCELMAPDSTGSGAKVPRLDGTEVERLEALIDDWTARMPALKRFVHPGGTPGASQLHVARTTCRSPERRVHALSRAGPAGPTLGRYLNRLADVLFTAARFANHVAGVPDRLSRAAER